LFLSMDAARDVLKNSLGRALIGLSPADRLSAAWVVACVRAIADRGEVVGYRDGIVEVAVNGRPWLEQFRAMGTELERELARIAGLPVTGIHFYEKRMSTGE